MRLGHRRHHAPSPSPRVQRDREGQARRGRAVPLVARVHDGARVPGRRPDHAGHLRPATRARRVSRQLGRPDRLHARRRGRARPPRVQGGLPATPLRPVREGRRGVRLVRRVRAGASLREGSVRGRGSREGGRGLRRSAVRHGPPLHRGQMRPAPQGGRRVPRRRRVPWNVRQGSARRPGHVHQGLQLRLDVSERAGLGEAAAQRVGEARQEAITASSRRRRPAQRPPRRP